MVGEGVRMQVILLTVLQVVFWIVAAILVAVILGGIYMLATGRVPPPRRWWAGRSRTGHTLARPRGLGLGLVVICGVELVVVWVGLAQIASFNEPSEPTGLVGLAATWIGTCGVACMTASIYLQKWAYRAAPNRRE